jgi:predicted nucleic acid-binding protein
MATHLADKSAFTRRTSKPSVREVVEPMLLAGRIATCGIIDLELLYSAPSPAVYAELAGVLQAMPRVPVTDGMVNRALEVQGQLASVSQHRSVTLPDLLVAATAELSGLIVLHYDADFDRIAAVTGQRAEWVVPRGSIS